MSSQPGPILLVLFKWLRLEGIERWVVWRRGGSGTLKHPQLLYTITEPGVGQAGTFGRWHSAAFTWDGKVLALGWEPGGGGAPFCTANVPFAPTRTRVECPLRVKSRKAAWGGGSQGSP